MAEMTGSCMCGDVMYALAGDYFGVVSCHCKECQRLHGNYNPMIVGEKSQFSIQDEQAVGWYDSSEEKDRGFCKRCGSALFMRQKNGPKILISVGSLDETEGLKNVKNIFTEEAGAYYVLPTEETGD